LRRSVAAAVQGDVDNETEERLEFCLGDLEVGDGIGHGERDLIFCSPLGNYITVPNIYIYICMYIYIYVYIYIYPTLGERNIIFKSAFLRGYVSLPGVLNGIDVRK